MSLPALMTHTCVMGTRAPPPQRFSFICTDSVARLPRLRFMSIAFLPAISAMISVEAGASTSFSRTTELGLDSLMLVDVHALLRTAFQEHDGDADRKDDNSVLDAKLVFR